ncbi:MAG: GDYXXLXY domain-containing protein [Cyanobacteria bacterium SID2]|nr:GDYXXLXY domain-containing protein [Cyanobacteria bacterium SID2]
MNPESPITVPQTQPQTQLPPKRKLPLWRLGIPLVLQTLLIVAVPARDAYVFANGTPVVLQTAPVDPYDLMRGYYQILNYEISQTNTLSSLPGGETLFGSYRQGSSFDFYVVLEAPESPTSQPPSPWIPVRVSEDFPKNLPDHQIALRGQYRQWRVTYGLETYYMPEDRREEINATIRQIQQDSPEAFLVEVRVGQQADAVPVSLWVRDRNYQF